MWSPSAGIAASASPESRKTTLSAASVIASRSLRPVVKCTGSPMRLSGMRCAAASAWAALIPGITTVSKATAPPARIASRMRSVLS